MRKVRVKAFAKVNLTLEVLGLRPDGFHDLRTIFQTISLHDTIEITFSPGAGTRVAIDSNINIRNNIMVRAAETVLEETNVRGSVGFVSQKPYNARAMSTTSLKTP